MKTWFYTILLCLGCVGAAQAGEPSTYFNIYVVPNNDAVQRNVALIITAINDSTTFQIVDDDADGDNDDSKSGVLMAGQSYILYIKDNGINDDARYASGGILKNDGDYFIITSDKLIYASTSTDSDWQHDFVCSANKKSVGQNFTIYAPKITSSNRDLNVFAFEDNTTVTISKISASPTLQTGYTNIDLENKTIVAQRTLNRGQDIIYFYQNGRNIMVSGETYLIESNKGVSVQYGALFGNERDGGGQVPASNGSSTGELFYFAVPYQAVGEQEIRIVSWDNNNAVTLERYSNGTWINMKSWTLNYLKPAEWVGKSNGNVSYPTVFRVSCTAGKRVSVLEANWMETGSPGTSDMATMLASEDGTSSGTDFLAYLLPPGKQNNVVNPFTGLAFGGNFTHIYLYAGKDTAHVNLKDVNTNGTTINRNYTILPYKYADAYFSEAEWKSIYNGTGTVQGGAQRPYITVHSDKRIATMIANTNDNWMMYFGSSLPQSFQQALVNSPTQAIPSDTVRVITSIVSAGAQVIDNPTINVKLSSGLLPIGSTLENQGNTQQGNIVFKDTESNISFANVPDILPTDNYQITTTCKVSATYNNGLPINNKTVLSVETQITGTVDGEAQQSILTQGIENATSNTSQLIFSNCTSGDLLTSLSDSWNVAWIDYNNDGWEDIYITDKGASLPNKLYRNNGNGTFTKITTGTLANISALSVSSAWADVNNDGWIDVFVVNATGKKSSLYLNTNGTFTEASNTGIDDQPQYFHGAVWADFDKDGFVDLLITNFFETRFHQFYKNNGNNTFTRIQNVVTTESQQALSPILADYNHDGLTDIFIPNGGNKPNSLFKNIGNFQFEKITTGAIATDAFNSVGACWGDYDGDGWVDLFVTNASAQNDNLYKNNGNGTFTKINALPTADASHTHGANWADMDNDSDLDLLVTNDQGRNFLYIHDGAGNFTKKVDEFVSGNTGKSFGQAWADYDKNGALDVLISTHSNQTDKLFCGQTSNNRWVNIRLQGTYSNKSAIGSQVKIKAGGKWQVKQLYPINGLGSQNSLRLHFGVGNATAIDSIEVKWTSGYTQYLQNVNTNQFMTITEEASNEVQGLVFRDENNNCTKETNEIVLANTPLRIMPQNLMISTNENGAFKVRLPAGTYTLQGITDTHWQASCSTNVSPSNNQSITNVQVALKPIVLQHDLAISTATTAWRRGFHNQTVVSCQNIGTATAHNVQISLQYPAQVALLSASKNWNNPQNDLYTWTLDSLRAGEAYYIMLTDSVKLTASVGQILELTSQIQATGADFNPNNNQENAQIPIVGAIDPNDILVTPAGSSAEGFIPKEQNLAYTIRFQNVGTYYATYVRIENQLPANLDRSTFRVLGSSHPYRLTLDAEGKIQVWYNNINLPDSTTNESQSHGYFRYSIQPKQTLQAGDEIINQASIIFDYEDAILTNTVLNTISPDKGKKPFALPIYPNPADNNINLKTYASMQKLWIYTLQGDLVATIEQPSERINIAHLKNGVYMLKALDFANMWYVGKLVVSR